MNYYERRRLCMVPGGNRQGSTGSLGTGATQEAWVGYQNHKRHEMELTEFRSRLDALKAQIE